MNILVKLACLAGGAAIAVACSVEAYTHFVREPATQQGNRS